MGVCVHVFSLFFSLCVCLPVLYYILLRVEFLVCFDGQHRSV